MSDPTRDELQTSTGGRYQIEGFLAQGGMGMVYTARNRSLGSRVAIKVLPPAVAASDVRLARFRREAALAANLSHPNIVPVFEFDATPSLAYLIMPLVEGQTLAEQLAEGGRMQAAEVLQLVDDVGKALAFAHKNGVIHRDIKPANLIQEKATGRWMVMDFGVAHSQRADDTEITRTGVVLGTPAYMPPEQAIGGRVDERTDLYSLAAVVVQALTGLGFEDLADCLTRGRTTIERVVKMAQPRLRQALVKALIWPLEKVPDDRPASAEAWLTAIDDAERTRSLYRWAWVAAVAAVAIAGFVMLRPGPAAVAPPIPTIAVAPFRGDMPAGTSGITVANLADALDWQLKFLPGHRLLGASFRQEIESRYGAAPVETDALMELARDQGASQVVEGRAGSRGDLLTLEILVYDAGSQRRIASADTVGLADSLDALVSALVVEAFAERNEQRLSGWKRALPRGWDATSAFLQGNLDLRRGAYSRAVEQYDEVIGLDSTYAPAHFNRMFALIFGARTSEYSVHLRSGLRAAHAYREDLDPLSQRLLEGYELLLREGDLRGGEELAQEIVGANPEAVDAWFLLGFVQFNFGALIGRDPAEAQYQFQRAADLDSSFAMAWWHLGEIAALLGENDRAEAALRRLLELDSASIWAEQAEVLASVVFEGEVMNVLRSFRETSIPALELISTSLAVLEPPAGTRPIMRAALEEFWRRSTSSYDLRLAFRMRMAALLADGQWASAVEHLAEGATRRVPQDELDRWIVLSAISPLPDLASDSEQRESAGRLLDETRDPAEARWLAARWLLQGGSPEAQQATSALREIVADSTTSSPHARSLLLDIEASRSLARGDSSRADSLWVAATRFYSVDDLIYGLTASLWPLRLARAQLAAARSEHATVVDIAESFMLLSGFTHQAAWPILMPLGAEGYAETGHPLRARELYGTLEELLEDADGGGIERLNEVRSKRAASGN